MFIENLVILENVDKLCSLLMQEFREQSSICDLNRWNMVNLFVFFFKCLVLVFKFIYTTFTKISKMPSLSVITIVFTGSMLSFSLSIHFSLIWSAKINKNWKLEQIVFLFFVNFTSFSFHKILLCFHFSLRFEL